MQRTCLTIFLAQMIKWNSHCNMIQLEPQVTISVETRAVLWRSLTPVSTLRKLSDHKTNDHSSNVFKLIETKKTTPLSYSLTRIIAKISKTKFSATWIHLRKRRKSRKSEKNMSRCLLTWRMMKIWAQKYSFLILMTILGLNLIKEVNLWFSQGLQRRLNQKSWRKFQIIWSQMQLGLCERQTNPMRWLKKWKKQVMQESSAFRLNLKIQYLDSQLWSSSKAFWLRSKEMQTRLTMLC